MNGVLFCQGHNHRDTPRPRPSNVNWIYVDVDAAVKPDIIGSYTDPKVLQTLGYDNYDYVYEMNCPIHSSAYTLGRFLQSAYKLLKVGGRVYIGYLITTMRNLISFKPIITEKEEAEENDKFWAGERISTLILLNKMAYDGNFIIEEIVHEGEYRGSCILRKPRPNIPYKAYIPDPYTPAQYIKARLLIHY